MRSHAHAPIHVCAYQVVHRALIGALPMSIFCNLVRNLTIYCQSTVPWPLQWVAHACMCTRVCNYTPLVQFGCNLSIYLPKFYDLAHACALAHDWCNFIPIWQFIRQNFMIWLIWTGSANLENLQINFLIWPVFWPNLANLEIFKKLHTKLIFVHAHGIFDGFSCATHLSCTTVPISRPF